MKKRSIGQWLALAGNLVICIDLLLNGFELISRTTFRAIIIIAVVIDISALVVIWKKSEF